MLCWAAKQTKYCRTRMDCTFTAKTSIYCMTLRDDIQQWIGLTIPKGEVKKVLEDIKRKNRKQFPKEVITIIWGAMIYHTWKTRNLNYFRGSSVNTNIVLAHIKKEVIERLNLLKGSRKASNSQSWKPMHLSTLPRRRLR
ncbi:hypothetical protein H5410_035780 [Solanum commersonii]|uniref:Uncharacterized protein n=1 Tax=Solanum commersonii TaxID=4109 RepID=A0A9J5Y5Q9_SOLCO|nr:hypothetical protein H5410_035780 [Solanum commersonii]